MRHLSICLVLLFVTGCGGGDDRPSVYPVKGKLTVGGSPLADALVTFIPESGPSAIGKTDSGGVFTLTTFEAGDGAVAGNHTVVVSKTEGGEGEDYDAEAMLTGGGAPGVAGDEPKEIEIKELIPQEYTSRMSSPLKKEVKDGGNEEMVIEIP